MTMTQWTTLAAMTPTGRKSLHNKPFTLMEFQNSYFLTEEALMPEYVPLEGAWPRDV